MKRLLMPTSEFVSYRLTNTHASNDQEQEHTILSTDKHAFVTDWTIHNIDSTGNESKTYTRNDEFIVEW